MASSSSCAGSEYSPSSPVTTFHGIPHVDIDLNESPDQFDTSLDYLEAVIIWGFVPILVCVLIFILMSVYFICVCCCCCVAEKEKATRRSKGCCGVFSTLLIVICLVILGVGFWVEVELNRDVEQFISTAEDAEAFLNNPAGGYNATFTADALTRLETGISDGPSTGGQAAALNAVTNLITENEAIGSAFMTVDDMIPDIADISQINRVETIRHWVIIGYMILVTLLLVVMVLALCCGIKTVKPTCIIVTLVIFFFLTFTIWVGVGGTLSFLMVSSDICFDPDDLVRTLANDSSAGSASLPIVNYYLVCNDSCVANPFSDEIDSANTALAQVDIDVATVQSYVMTELPTLQEELNTVIAQFNSSKDAIAEVSTCSAVHEDYIDILTSICDDAFTFAVTLFGLVCGLAVFAMVLLVSGAFLAGLLGRKGYDEEALTYEFPPDSGPSAWESYGTQHQHSSGSTPRGQYTYTQYRENINLTATSPGGASEPPKYTEIEHNMSNGQQQQPQRQRHSSGSYDHFDT